MAHRTDTSVGVPSLSPRTVSFADGAYAESVHLSKTVRLHALPSVTVDIDTLFAPIR